MSHIRTSTKEIGASGHVEDDFTVSPMHTVFKVKTADVVGPVKISNANVDKVSRFLDMTDNAGFLHDVEVANVTARVTAWFARLRRAENVTFTDCVAIGTGKDAAVDSYPSGFHTSNLPTNNITYLRCEAHGFWSKDQTPGKYWYGDGAADEEQGTRMRYVDCHFWDNADAGLDTKSHGVEVVRLHAHDNHRNLRLWGSGAIKNLLSENPRSAHIWAGGGERLGSYTIENPVFVGGTNKPHLQVDSGTPGSVITIVDPVVPEGETFRVLQQGDGKNVEVEVFRTQPARVPVFGSWIPGDLNTLQFD